MNQFEEKSFQEKMDAAAQCWRNGVAKEFINSRHQTIAYYTLQAKQHEKVILISNGRCEGYLKYQEVAYELFLNGFDIILIDHSGQGFSERLLSDPELGHIEHFSDYVDDLKECYDLTLLSKTYRERYLLAHSLGSCIGTRLIQKYPNLFDKVLLSAPLFGINLPLHLVPFARKLAALLDRLDKTPNYTITQTKYKKKFFRFNRLTNSLQRYRWWQELCEEHPQLKLGGPSNHWITEVYKTIDSCFIDINKIEIPCLVWLAGQEKIVSNKAIKLFYSKMKQHDKSIELQIYPDAKHEILFEKDLTRDQAIANLLLFFKPNS